LKTGGQAGARLAQLSMRRLKRHKTRRLVTRSQKIMTRMTNYKLLGSIDFAAL